MHSAASSAQPEPDSNSTPLHWLPSGPLAQLVEQGTLNPKVEGSNPSRPIPSRVVERNPHGGHDPLNAHVPSSPVTDPAIRMLQMRQPPGPHGRGANEIYG